MSPSRRTVVGGLLAVPALALLTPQARAQAGAVRPAAASRPMTIPALQEWSEGPGCYRFTGRSRVVVDSRYSSRLATTAEVFAEDLSQLLGRSVGRVTARAPRPGDLFLTLGSTDKRLSAYTLKVGTSVTIRGAADDGVFYGTRSLLQLLKQSTTIPGGTAHDWAAYPERGLMVDVGRKYFTVGWLKQHIKDLSYAKLNHLHLHLSDNLGFRVESERHPKAVSAQHYTKDEIRDLIAYAAKHHITVVPEIDAPGHMNPFLDVYTDLQLVDSDGKASNFRIDLTKQGAYDLVRDLIEEYVPLFPGPYWHIGADEYMINTDYAKFPQLLDYAREHYGPDATAADTYYGFINWANGVVKGLGKTTRMWNDGIKPADGTVKVDSDIIVEYWYDLHGSLPPAQLIERGHTIMNSSWTPTYYVLYNGGGARPDSKWMYETWNPDVFEKIPVDVKGHNRGSVLHVWCDHPNAEWEDDTAAGIHAPLRALAQQTWGSPRLVGSYAEFATLITAVGRAPGGPNETKAVNLALNKPATASSTETPDFPASKAVDGLRNTRWASAYTDPQWLQIDLGTSQRVNRIRLRWETAYAKAFQIQLSDDATNWTTLYSTTNATGGAQEFTDLNGQGRYLRIHCTQRATGYGNSLWEVEAYA
ncbi:family 20 glycosylhydrolase [Streptomyces formicae]|uniref:Family 20 glycosylhydrolase n=1 Tax=Streptomyces formicae TaxID=1616117 RepID=A0ABY3WMY3_9ACTN|nr:family 20 glycosylhydrolase [Streptomyces formicae]UNM12147.1 family 20 glycosylhydrolase [Streptomyces formicae]